MKASQNTGPVPLQAVEKLLRGPILGAAVLCVPLVRVRSSPPISARSLRFSTACYGSKPGEWFCPFAFGFLWLFSITARDTAFIRVHAWRFFALFVDEW